MHSSVWDLTGGFVRLVMGHCGTASVLKLSGCGLFTVSPGFFAR